MTLQVQCGLIAAACDDSDNGKIRYLRRIAVIVY